MTNQESNQETNEIKTLAQLAKHPLDHIKISWIASTTNFCT